MRECIDKEDYMYIASDKRYETMKYNRCGKSGLLLPAVSLGRAGAGQRGEELWQDLQREFQALQG